MHFIVTQEISLGGHLAVTAVAQSLLHLSKTGAVEPDFVGQVRCAHGLLALTFSAMTDCTIGREDILTCGKVNFDTFRIFQARQGANVAGNVTDAFFADAVLPRWHRRLTAGHDGGFDGFRLAAIQPVIVSQVREAICALGIRAVADRAVGGKQAAAHFQRLLVLSHLLDRHGSIFGKDWAVLAFSLGHFLFPMMHTGPACIALGTTSNFDVRCERLLRFSIEVVIAWQQTFPVTQARVERQVAEGEYDGANKQHEPPFGQRVVELFDTVEGVADSFFGGFFALALAGAEDQPSQGKDGAQRQNGYVPTPERGHWLLLLEDCSSRSLGLGSSAKGRLAASSKLDLRLLL